MFKSGQCFPSMKRPKDENCSGSNNSNSNSNSSINNSNIKAKGNDLKPWITGLKLYAVAVFLLLASTQIDWGNSSIFEYFWPDRGLSSYSSNVLNIPNVLFEVSERQDKFIRDTAKILGNKLSDLDFCQQKVIIQLKSSCKSLNDEQLGKLAVALMNCQLTSEGRPTYECSDAMNLKECTQDMSTEIWNNYNLFLGRSKSICLLIRQDQFRGLTEMTVNRLMESVTQHLQMMEELKKSQKQLEESTLGSIDEMAENNLKLMEKQQELLRLAESQRINTEANLKEIIREKNLIKLGQTEISSFLTSLRAKIDQGLAELQDQSDQSREIFKELVKDLTGLHNAAVKISDHLDDTNALIISQNQKTNEQIKETIVQLREANKIVFDFSRRIGSVQKDVLSNIEWLNKYLGGDKDFFKNVTVVVAHVSYLLIGMICLVFISADFLSRLVLLSVISLNMTAVLYEFIEMDLSLLTETILALLTANLVVKFSRKFDWKKHFALNTTLGVPPIITNSSRPTVMAHQNGCIPQGNSSRTTESRSDRIIRNSEIDYSNYTMSDINDSNNSNVNNESNFQSDSSIRIRHLTMEPEITPTNTFRESQDDQRSDRSHSSYSSRTSMQTDDGYTHNGLLPNIRKVI